MPTTSSFAAATPISRRGDTSRMRAALAALACLALCACSFFDKEPPKAPPGPVYSPNGEPLSGGALGDPKCEDAMQRWFAKADADHDGTIDLGEFLSDARRQFAAMDLEHTGVLTPAVLAQYRAPYLAERGRREARNDEGDDDDDSDDDQQRGRRRRDSGRGPPAGQDRADPVMMADVNLRNRVTLDDFVAYARRNFAVLDTGKNGRLSSAEVVATCPPP